MVYGGTESQEITQILLQLKMERKNWGTVRARRNLHEFPSSRGEGCGDCLGACGADASPSVLCQRVKMGFSGELPVDPTDHP